MTARRSDADWAKWLGTAEAEQIVKGHKMLSFRQACHHIGVTFGEMGGMLEAGTAPLHVRRPEGHAFPLGGLDHWRAQASQW